MNKYGKLAKIARERSHRERSCESKRRYATKEEAYCKNQEVYRCKYCGGWHRSGVLFRVVRQAAIRNQRRMVRNDG
jgi:hypothetical protein